MKAAHVVFEGIDRCGKSSLVEKMRVETGWDYFKMRVPTTLQESGEYYDEHLNHLCDSEEPSIWDRGLLSEVVYGSLYRPEQCPAWYRRQLMERTRRASMLPIVVVYIYPLYDALLLPDERPGADRYEEQIRFSQAYYQCYWRKIAMTKHTVRDGQPAWKNRDASWYELLTLLESIV